MSLSWARVWPGWWRPVNWWIAAKSRHRRTGKRRQSRWAGVLVFGGLFFVNSPEQRRLGIKDSHELALQDWLGTAGFDRPEDHWPRQWAHAYVDFAAGEKRSWLRARGYRPFPSWHGLNAAARMPWGRETRCRDSISRGARALGWWRSSPGACSPRWIAVRYASPTATRSTNWWSIRVPSWVCGDGVGAFDGRARYRVITN